MGKGKKNDPSFYLAHKLYSYCVFSLYIFCVNEYINNSHKTEISMLKNSLLFWLSNKKCFLSKSVSWQPLFVKAVLYSLYGCSILYLTVPYFWILRRFLTLFPFKKIFMESPGIYIFSHFGYFFGIHVHTRIC